MRAPVSDQLALYGVGTPAHPDCPAMPPLHLLVHADSPENAALIERALRTGAPAFTVQIVSDSAALRPAADGMVAVSPAAQGPAAAAHSPSMSSTIRHELNNHLGIIRMLADYLIADHKLPAVAIAKVQEIGNAAEAAARAVRQTKPPE